MNKFVNGKSIFHLMFTAQLNIHKNAHLCYVYMNHNKVLSLLICRVSHSFMPSFISVETVTTNTHSEGFGQPGAEVVEHDGDDVLVRDVGVARFEVHLPRPHQVQGVLKRDL